MYNDDIEFRVYETKEAKSAVQLERFQQFLRQAGLTLDNDIECYILVKKQGDLIACAGLAGNLIKCVAVSTEHRGHHLSRRIIEEITILASQKGIFHLFLYTEPSNVRFFKSCGFHLIATASNNVSLLENNPKGLERHCRKLHGSYKKGDRIGSIVMNANPFTFGHQYLIEQAAADCDWLHIFVVSTDVSQFSFESRFNMVRTGSQHLNNVTVHVGGNYIISRATFPHYFLKDSLLADQSFTAIDLMLFRQHIAPTLGITHRYVGTEPFCQVTARYNQDMHHWLEEELVSAPYVKVVEIDRKRDEVGVEISASGVRRLMKENNEDVDWMESLRHIVPETTVKYCACQSG